MAETITIPDADTQLTLAINKRARKSGSQVLEADQKFACVILKFAPAVTQEDYPVLKTALEAVAGIQEVALLVDGKIPASLPVDTQARLHLAAQIQLKEIPNPE
jgi:hypothetical protein